ncbi:unnamed protein product [Arctogadus glacialis]
MGTSSSSDIVPSFLFFLPYQMCSVCPPPCLEHRPAPGPTPPSPHRSRPPPAPSPLTRPPTAARDHLHESPRPPRSPPDRSPAHNAPPPPPPPRHTHQPHPIFPAESPPPPPPRVSRLPLPQGRKQALPTPPHRRTGAATASGLPARYPPTPRVRSGSATHPSHPPPAPSVRSQPRDPAPTHSNTLHSNRLPSLSLTTATDSPRPPHSAATHPPAPPHTPVPAAASPAVFPSRIRTRNARPPLRYRGHPIIRAAVSQGVSHLHRSPPPPPPPHPTAITFPECRPAGVTPPASATDGLKHGPRAGPHPPQQG